MLRIIVMLAIILVNYTLQSTVFQSLSIMGVTPDTALILIVSYGIMRGDIEGAIFGFACGLVHDVMGSGILGLYAMMGMLIGFVCGKPFKDFFHDNYFLPFFAVVIATVAHQFMFFCAAVLFTGSVDLFYYSRVIILPKTIYTASLSIPLYMLMFFINHKIEIYEYNRRNLFEE